jgi:hypothetical protein
MLFIAYGPQFRKDNCFFLTAYTIKVVYFDCHAEDSFKFMDEYFDVAEGMLRQLVLVFIGELGLDCIAFPGDDYTENQERE